MWQVMRHSGRYSGHWRCLLATPDGQRATDRYHAEWLKFRQGAVALIRPDGAVAAQDGEMSGGIWRTRP